MKRQTFEFTATIRGRLTVDVDHRYELYETFAKKAAGSVEKLLAEVAPPGIGPLVIDQVKVDEDSIRFVTEEQH